MDTVEETRRKESFAGTCSDCLVLTDRDALRMVGWRDPSDHRRAHPGGARPCQGAGISPPVYTQEENP